MRYDSGTDARTIADALGITVQRFYQLEHEDVFHPTDDRARNRLFKIGPSLVSYVGYWRTIRLESMRPRDMKRKHRWELWGCRADRRMRIMAHDLRALERGEAWSHFESWWYSPYCKMYDFALFSTLVIRDTVETLGEAFKEAPDARQAADWAGEIVAVSIGRMNRYAYDPSKLVEHDNAVFRFMESKNGTLDVL